MIEEIKNRLKEIYEIVRIMEYSEDNFLELISLVKEAKSYVENDKESYHCYNQIRQTWQKQIKDMMLKDLPSKERKIYFERARSNFTIDLNMFCL